MPTAPAPMLDRVTCPHCWSGFAPEDILWIAAHDDLRGDPRLGPDEHLRFLPTRFTVEGQALDAHGFPCHALACPRCHLAVPRALLHAEPSFVSILGAPACGKSFFLAAMTGQLRRLLPHDFALDFHDTDPTANLKLIEYEQSLFLNRQAADFVYLDALIRKTETQGDLYDTVTFGNQAVSYPRPFLFTLTPRDHHPARVTGARGGRVLCLYDNAGEHFLPGQDSTATPATRHLAQAFLLLFLFDPLQDTRFLDLCRQRGQALPGPQVLVGQRSGAIRQETILHEAATRVRRALSLPADARHNRPLLVVVTKCDVWSWLLGPDPLGEPYRAHNGTGGVHRDVVENASARLRELLTQACPELVSTAESFAREVIYLPVSALGSVPSQGPKGLAIRPGAIKPMWVTVPLMYGMCRWLTGLVPAVKKSKGSGSHPALGPVPGPPPRRL